jgi:hypothetical protein
MQTVMPPGTAAPIITGISPASDTIGGSVTISGQNFSADTAGETVRFNGTPALITAATASQLIALVPPGATTGNIIVIVDGVSGSSPSTFTVTGGGVGPVPTITNFTPQTDTIGARITISGTNFSSTPQNDTVKFNGVVAQVISASWSQLTVIVPTNALSGKISVTVGSQTATSSASFTLLTPTIGSFTPQTDTVGAQITITGSNFSSTPGLDTVRFNGQPATVVSATPGQLIVLVPDYAIIGNITVTVGAQTVTAPGVFTITGVSTLAGGPGDAFSDGAGMYAAFSTLQGLATDANNNVYVVDMQNQRIRKVTPGGVVTTIAGNGGIGPVDGPAMSANFDEPLGVAVAANGDVYVADNADDRIRKISAGQVSTFASVIGPGPIAVDKNENIYVTPGSYAVIKIDPSGVKTVLAGDTILSGYQNGQGSGALFGGIHAITVDANNNIFVADQGNSVIRMITPSGMVSTVAGIPGTSGDQDGPIAGATFNVIYAMAIDANGNLYLTEPNKVRKIDFSTGMVSTYAGSANFSPLSLNGSFFVATFDILQGICVDNNGIVYVSSINEVRRISAH